MNAQNPEVFEIWEENGFRATRASFICYDIELRFDNTERRKCISWLRDNLQPYYIGENFQCAHAGIEKEWINENSQETLIWDRDSAGVYQGRLTIVGHTPLRAPTYYPGNGTVRELPYDKELPLPKIGIINIDAGCVFERKLTAMIVEGGSFKLVGTEYNA